MIPEAALGGTMRSPRTLFLAVLLACVAFSIGCGSSSSSSTSTAGGKSVPGYGEGTGAAGQTAPAKFMYVNPLGVGGPHALAIQSDGTLTEQTADGAYNNIPMTMAIDPSGSFVFQTALQFQLTQQGGLFAYAIDRSTGALTTATGSPYAIPQTVFTDIVDNAGKYLYVQGTSGVYAFSIQSGGALTAVPGSPFSDAGGPSSVGFTTPASLMAVDQTNQFLYVSTSGGISAYSINSTTGMLSPIAGSPFGSNMGTPWSITVTPNNKFLYEVDAKQATVFYAYSIDQSSGVLTAISGSPFNPGACGNSLQGVPGPDNLTIATAGKFLYDNCGIYSLDADTGAIAQTSTFTAGDWPVIDPTGNFLWAITPQQNCFHCEVGITAYTVDPNSGTLTMVPNSLIDLTNSEVGYLDSIAITK
jgi:6-phosphogluconolactonase